MQDVNMDFCKLPWCINMNQSIFICLVYTQSVSHEACLSVNVCF